MDAIWNQIVENTLRVAAHPWARQLVADLKRVFIESAIRLLEETMASEPQGSRQPRPNGLAALRQLRREDVYTTRRPDSPKVRRKDP